MTTPDTAMQPIRCGKQLLGVGRNSTMSKISIFVETPCDVVRVIEILRPLTGASVSSIRSAINSHSSVFERELFLNDHNEIAACLRRMLSEFEQAALHFEICEDGVGISPEILRNILDSHDKRAQSPHI